MSAAPRTLWSQGGRPDPMMLEYTVADDRVLDRRLLRWDILGSLGHAEGLRRSGLLSAAEHARLRRGLRAALAAAGTGGLSIGRAHEDAHSAVEFWLVRRIGAAGERLHTGRSRNDQVACDLRLFLKDAVLDLEHHALSLAGALVAFAARHHRVLWPGYTHQRRAMPSTAGLWALGHAEGLLDTVEAAAGFWAALDRSPLGSAAGYGVPLPLRREAAARALGFAGVEHAVTAVQNGRGKLEAAVLFWCAQFGHDLSKLATDVILFSAEEFGYLRLPPDLATGSSLMPQKRNPDLFELTRARAAVVEGALAETLALRARLPSGYHRDFQFLKAPLFRGLDATREALAMLAVAVPRLEVDRERAASATRGDLLATDEALRRAREGVPFRTAYREVAAELRGGVAAPALGSRAVLAARRSTGGAGRLDLPLVRTRLRADLRRTRARRARFARALERLAGRKGSI